MLDGVLASGDSGLDSGLFAKAKPRNDKLPPQLADLVAVEGELGDLRPGVLLTPEGDHRLIPLLEQWAAGRILGIDLFRRLP
jgi:hypothetical protein